MFGEDAVITSYSFETKLSIQLTLYTNKTVAGSKKSKKKTESKAKKTKEATFTLSSNNISNSFNVCSSSMDRTPTIRLQNIKDLGSSIFFRCRKCMSFFLF